MGVASEKARRKRLVRTNIVLDEALVREAMELTGIQTKRGVLTEALQRLVEVERQQSIWKLRGTVDWEGDLQEMRRERIRDGGR